MSESRAKAPLRLTQLKCLCTLVYQLMECWVLTGSISHGARSLLSAMFSRLLTIFHSFTSALFLHALSLGFRPPSCLQIMLWLLGRGGSSPRLQCCAVWWGGDKSFGDDLFSYLDYCTDFQSCIQKSAAVTVTALKISLGAGILSLTFVFVTPFIS